MNNKRPYIYLPIFFALTLIFGILMGTLLIPAFNSKNGIFSAWGKKYDKFGDILNFIQEQYVDSTDRAGLEELAINGLLQKLDPHSVYISADDFNEANDPLKANFEGIGVQFRIIRDTITIISVIPGGPSEKAGLQDGDRILTINSKKSFGIGIQSEEVMKQLKGPGGTKVQLGMYRKAQHKRFSQEITRGNIPTRSVDFAYMAAPGIGYVKISRFAENTYIEFTAAVEELQNQGMKSIILDLRANGGGLMDAAINIADEFLADKKLIVYLEGYHRKKQRFFAICQGDLESTLVVVLIDEFSASASEILAGALQDNDRATIIGRRSFGKGLVQEQIQLPDQSAIRLTVARYHTPTGRCIQKPYTEDVEKYYADFYKQFMTDEEYQDSLNFVDTTRYLTPGGKVVYGGGGIMPDQYVSAQSEFVSNYYKTLLYNGCFIDFAFDYADRNRTRLRAYGNAENFIRNFRVSPALMEEFVAFAEKAGVKRNPGAMALSVQAIQTELKGQIGRVIFNDDAYYPVIIPNDKMMQKALGTLKKQAR